MADQPKHVTYADAGVDVDEGARAVDCIKDAVKATNRPEVIGGLGGFGSCFSMKGFKDMEDPVLVSGTDGVGTKLAIAQLLDRHDTVGEDLVAMCVDDVVPIARPSPCLYVVPSASCAPSTWRRSSRASPTAARRAAARSWAARWPSTPAS